MATNIDSDLFLSIEHTTESSEEEESIAEVGLYFVISWSKKT